MDFDGLRGLYCPCVFAGEAGVLWAGAVAQVGDDFERRGFERGSEGSCGARAFEEGAGEECGEEGCEEDACWEKDGGEKDSEQNDRGWEEVCCGEGCREEECAAQVFEVSFLKHAWRG